MKLNDNLSEVLSIIAFLFLNFHKTFIPSFLLRHNFPADYSLHCSLFLFISTSLFISIFYYLLFQENFAIRKTISLALHSIFLFLMIQKIQQFSCYNFERLKIETSKLSTKFHKKIVEKFKKVR